MTPVFEGEAPVIVTAARLSVYGECAHLVSLGQVIKTMMNVALK